MSTCRHTTDLPQIRLDEEFQLPVVQFHPHPIPLGYFVVFGVSVDPCCPVQRRPACDGCVTTVRYRCPLTRMTCVSCVLPVSTSTCRRWCACCACNRDRTTTTELPCLVSPPCECFGRRDTFCGTFMTTRSPGGGLGGGNVPPSWLSPLFLCVGVSCSCRPPGLWEGVGGRERPPPPFPHSVLSL